MKKYDLILAVLYILPVILEVGTVNAGGRNTHWVYDADVGRVSGSEKCSHPTQAVTSFRTLLVVAASVVERDCLKKKKRER